MLAAALLPAAACSAPRATSSQEAKAVLSACGIGEDDLVWLIDDQGSFLFGRPSQDSPPLGESRIGCLTAWLERENVRSGAIGYEATQ